MTQRNDNITKWLWCLLALYSGPIWSPATCVSVKTPPKNPSTVEAQAKFFQDFFSVQLSPYKIEFGHVCEDPNTWEQRYEKKDYKNHRDMGKVRWGDKKGGYGEHYWDLNHAGHNNNNDNDDGSYNPEGDDGSYDHNRDSNDAYDEPSEQNPSYEEGTAYDPEKAAKSQYEESERRKRAQPRIKNERKYVKRHDYEDTERQEPEYKPRKNKPDQEEEEKYIHVSDDAEDETEKEEEEEEVVTKKPAPKRKIYKPKEQEEKQEVYETPEVKKVESPPEQFYASRRQPSRFVPYESGAGLRQHYQPELAAAPRLFLEPLTGHVVDRTTGQAYVLQPVLPNAYN